MLFHEYGWSDIEFKDICHLFFEGYTVLEIDGINDNQPIFCGTVTNALEFLERNSEELPNNLAVKYIDIESTNMFEDYLRSLDSKTPDLDENNITRAGYYMPVVRLKSCRNCSLNKSVDIDNHPFKF